MSRLSGSLRIRILERDGYKCVYCGTPSSEAPLEVDHVTPRAAGGSDSSTNLVTACRRCNNGKRANVIKLPAGVTPQPVAQPSPRRRWTSRTQDERSDRPYVLARTRTNHGRDTGMFRLSLYAEIDYTAVLGDADPYPDDPFDWYCARLRDNCPELWASDAVPILWCVEADGPGLNTSECAPWHSHGGRCGWDRFFSHPVDQAGKPIEWSKVPVHMRRFNGFESSIGWLPSIEDRSAPVKSLWVAKHTKAAEELPQTLRLPCPECGVSRVFDRPQLRCEDCDIWLIGKATVAGSTIVNLDRTWVMCEDGWTPARFIDKSA